MTPLPITRIILFKHGVGYFERRGNYEGERLELSFPREAMDDVLKSLVTLDLGSGQVFGVDFETPEDRAARLARGSIHLSDQQSLLDLLRDLRGRRVRLSLGEGKKAEPPCEGLVVGVDYEAEEPLKRATVSLYLPESRQVRSLAIADLAWLDLLDDGAAADLAYFLSAAQSEEQRRAATVRLSPGAHDLLVAYITPAPAWRVSYRMLFEQAPEQVELPEGSTEATRAPAAGSFCLLQGWGLFDNQLEEDLAGVELTLMAGMPVSFRYRLYEPHTPERPLVQDEERTVDAPIFFEAAAPPVPMAPPAMARTMMAGVAAMMEDGMAMPAEPARRISAEKLQSSTTAAAAGDERGALFAYRVAHPVSVARGQSAMVPIISQQLPARRELLYNGAKFAQHPVASLRLQNATGLTLERGPVTVLAMGDYAGEAVLPFTRAGAELIVPFAVELGIKVVEQRRGERRMIGLSVQGEYAIFEEHDLAHTTFEVNSSLDQTVEVTVELSRRADYTIVEPRQPDEESAGFARWRVACPPLTRVSFTITERRRTSRHELVRSLNGNRLQEYLRERLLDANTFRALNGILELYGQIDTQQQQLVQLDKERKTIFKQQSQIQGNLQPLGREGEEGALRQRYVNTLGQLEDRLVAISAAEEALHAAISQLEEQIGRRLKRLTGRRNHDQEA